ESACPSETLQESRQFCLGTIDRLNIATMNADWPVRSWKCAIVVADPIHKSQSFKICVRPVSGRDEGILRCAISMHHVPIQLLRRCKACFEDDDGGLAFLDQKPKDSLSRLNQL